MTGNRFGEARSRARQSAAAAATVTVVGGTLVLAGQPAVALNIVVTSAADDGSGGLTLREAIAQANATPGVADDITFAPALAGQTITLTGGPLRADDDLTITGLGETSLTLTNAGGTILYLYNDASLTLSSITLSGAGASGVSGYGSGDITLSSVTVTGSVGDGVDFRSDLSRLSIINSTIDENGGHGVAVAATEADVTLFGSSLSSNDGRGLDASGTQALSALAIVGSVLSDNDGTGLYVREVLNASSVVASSVDRNLAGVVVLSTTGNVTIENSTSRNNGGEGVSVGTVGGDLTLSDTEVDNNGGTGVLALSLVSGSVAITGGSVDDNAGPGAVFYADVTGDVLLWGTSLSRNNADNLRLAGTVTGATAIVGSNLDASATADGLDATDLNNSLVVSTSTFDLNASTGVELSTVTGVVRLDKVSIADNGGYGVYLRAADAGLSVTGSSMDRNANHGLRVGSVTGDVDLKLSSFRDSLGASGVDIQAAGGDVTATEFVATGNQGNGATLENVAGNTAIASSDLSDNAGHGSLITVTNASSDITVTDTVVADNNALGLRVNVVGGDVKLLRSSVVGSGDAAVFASGVGRLTVLNSTMSGNGDGVFDPVIDVDGGGSVLIAHSTLSGNGVTGTVVPVLDVEDAAVTVNHSVVTKNSDADAFGASGAGSVSVTNSVVPVASGFAGLNVESNEPLLAALANNGGPTPTMVPSPGSPAVDAGDPGLGSSPATDQRGSARVVGGVVDIGAVERAAGSGTQADAVSPMTPARFVDTRAGGSTFDDRFEGEGQRPAGSEYRVQIGGRGGVPPRAKAVVINVTAVGAGGVGYATVHPCASPRPLTSSLNFTPGVNLANEIVAPLSSGGEICVYTSAPTQLLVDVVGFVDADSPTVPVTPSRFLDTRSAGATFDGVSQRSGRTAAGGAVTLQVAGRGAVPANAAAAIVNVTAVGPGEVGYVTAHPCAATPPNASSLNYSAGVNRANELIAPLSSTGQICLFSSSSVDLLVDVVGYVPAGSTLHPIVPARFLDTRPSGATVDGREERIGKQVAGSELELPVAGRPGVPDGASAVVINVTSVAADAAGFFTVHPCVAPRPLASSLNYVAGVNGANELIAQLDADGKLCIYTSEAAHLLVDVVGYID